MKKEVCLLATDTSKLLLFLFYHAVFLQRFEFTAREFSETINAHNAQGWINGRIVCENRRHRGDRSKFLLILNVNSFSCPVTSL
jgi:hypothetical protein